MKTPGKIKTHRNASAIVLVVFAILIIFLIGLALLSLGFHSRMTAIRTNAQISARCAADAGITQAFKLMNKKIEEEIVWNNSTLPIATDVVTDESTNANFSFTVTGNPTAGFQIDSEGKTGQETKTVHAFLKVGSLLTGIGTKEGANLKYGITLSTIPPNSPFTIRTNSTLDNAVILKTDVTVPGDIIVGPGGVPSDVIDTKQTTVITGQAYPASEPLSFPDVNIPTGLPNMGSITTTTTISQSGMYNSINLPNDAKLTIAGDCTVYVIGKTTLNQGAEITIQSGSLNLYLGGNLEDKNSGGMDNQTHNPTAFKIYGLPTCTQIDIKAKSGLFYGAVYAPSADLHMFNCSEIYGAFAGNSILLNNACNFHYVSALADVGIDDPTATLKMVRWWEP